VGRNVLYRWHYDVQEYGRAMTKFAFISRSNFCPPNLLVFPKFKFSRQRHCRVNPQKFHCYAVNIGKAKLSNGVEQTFSLSFFCIYFYLIFLKLFCYSLLPLP
jgi:hypothetical protein